nr:putative ribonuclease H-like domain-containing protein [Tanacetum cinerariifolium]
QSRLTQINDDDFYTCMFACFLSQEEPKRIHQALKDPSWIEAIHEELLQFKTQKVWVLVDLPKGFEDTDYHDKVYKVVKPLCGLHQAPRACQDNYVAEILRKFGLTDRKSASTPIDIEKPLLKDPDETVSGKDTSNPLMAENFPKIVWYSTHHVAQMKSWLVQKQTTLDSTYHKEKMLLCKEAEQGVPLQAEQYDWLADTDEEIDKQELEAHYIYITKI